MTQDPVIPVTLSTRNDGSTTPFVTDRFPSMIKRILPGSPESELEPAVSVGPTDCRCQVGNSARQLAGQVQIQTESGIGGSVFPEISARRIPVPVNNPAFSTMKPVARNPSDPPLNAAPPLSKGYPENVRPVW
jgi:hypothetical protein